MAWLSDPNWLTRAAQGGLQAYGEARNRGMAEQEMLAAQDYRQQQIDLQEQQLGQAYAQMQQQGTLERARLGQARDLAEAERKAAFRKGLVDQGAWRQLAALDAGKDPSTFLYTDLIQRAAASEKLEAEAKRAQIAANRATIYKAQHPTEILAPGHRAYRDGQLVASAPPAERSTAVPEGAILVDSVTGQLLARGAPRSTAIWAIDPNTGGYVQVGTAPGRAQVAPGRSGPPKEDSVEVQAPKVYAQFLREAMARAQANSTTLQQAEQEALSLYNSWRVGQQLEPIAKPEGLGEAFREWKGGGAVSADKAPPQKRSVSRPGGVKRTAPGARPTPQRSAGATSRQPAGAADAIEARTRYLKGVNYTPAEIAVSLARQYPLDKVRQHLGRAGYSQAQIWDAITTAHPQLGAR